MLVVYGSETGNAQDVAEMLAAYMKQAICPDTCALPMDCVTLEELSTEDLVLFVCATTGVIGRCGPCLRLDVVHSAGAGVSCPAMLPPG